MRAERSHLGLVAGFFRGLAPATIGVTLASAVALSALSGCSAKERAPTEEEKRRDAYARKIAAEADASVAHNLASSRDVRFEWGFSEIQYDPVGDISGRPFRWFGQRAFARLRTHGDKRLRVVFEGWANRQVIGCTPTISLIVDGTVLGSFRADEKSGAFGGFGIVSKRMVKDRDWVGLTIEISSVTYHWADIPELKVALTGKLEVTELPD